MPITVSCPSCGVVVQVPEAAAGRRGKCRKCGSVVQVPAANLKAIPQPLEDPAPYDIDTVAPAADPLLTCSRCKGSFTYAYLRNVNGTVVCRDCVAGPTSDRHPGADSVFTRRRRILWNGADADEAPRDRFRRLGRIYRLGGFAIQILLAPLLWIAINVSINAETLAAVVDFLLFGIGVAVMFVGFAYYAKEKNRSAAWCLAGFLGILGLLVLWSLEARNAAARKPY